MSNEPSNGQSPIPANEQPHPAIAPKENLNNLLANAELLKMNKEERLEALKKMYQKQRSDQENP